MGTLPPVRDVLFGRALSARPSDFMSDECRRINELLDKLLEVLMVEHTDAARVPRTSRAVRQADREMRAVRDFPSESPSAALSRRALVLYGMWHEPEFVDWLLAERSVDDQDADIVNDLVDRVLPIAAPVYLRGLGQRPDSFVALCATMIFLWPDCDFELDEIDGEDQNSWKVPV